MSDSDFQQLLTLARQRGASDAEVYATRSRSQLVTFEGNRLKQLETVSAEGVGLRLWREHRCGLAVAYGTFDSQTLVDKAIALSQLNAAAPIHLAETSPQTWDCPPLQTSVKAMVEQGEATLATLRDRYPDTICNGEWSLDFETTHLLNSRGVDCQFHDSSLSVSIGVEWVRGDDFLDVGVDETVSPRPSALTVSLHPEHWAEAIALRLDWATHTLTPPSGTYPVILTPNAATVLLETAIAASNGHHVMQKTSPWTDKLGQQVVSPLLTAIQQPEMGPFGTPFDDEGIPCQTAISIDRGHLNSLYCDLRAARALSMPANGNGYRSGLGSYPHPGLVNLILPATTTSFDELLRACDRGLVVDQVLGNGGGLAGDFSFNVDLGYWFESGTIVGRVKDTLVTGNAYTALNQILDFGCAPLALPNTGGREWAGSIFTPAIAISSLSITGQ